MKSDQFSPAMREVLRRVFVNMPWRQLKKFTDLVTENRINIQIGFEAGDLESVTADAACDAIGEIRDGGSRITVHGPFWDLCSGSMDPGIRKVTVSRLTGLFDIAEQFRPEQLVCHTGFDPRHHRFHHKAWVENSLCTWGPFVRRAETLGMPLVLENVFEDGPELHLDLIERIKSPWFGFCLDVGHQHAFSHTTLDKWLQAAWPHLKEVHLHDNDGSCDEHLPIGAGTIDFDYLFHFMCEKKISPLLTLEPHRLEHLYESLEKLAAMTSFKEMVIRES